MSSFTIRTARLWTMLALAALMAAGCAGAPVPPSPAAPPGPGVTSAPPTRPPRPATGATADLILARYREFWSALARVSESRPPRRQRLLANYMTEPELTRSLQAMAAQDAAGREVYGANRTQPVVHAVSAQEAEVTDCQNSSGSGVKERVTGVPITVGAEHNPVRTHLKRGVDGLWRISQVFYSGGAC